MIYSARVSHRLAHAVILSLLAAPLPASGATARKVKAISAVRSPLKADNSIIPLPLNPVLPPAQRLCAAQTPSGLGYTMLRPASGTKPTQDDLVLVNYIGYLASSGAVFDQGMRSAFPVSGVIPGFSEGLRMMARTGVARFCIPAALGYGTRATGPIPANADLVFQVELVDYKASTDPEPEAQPASPSPKSPAPQP
jgi:FKBP-type peptidyl-prolyl cis-trans isomerase FkpA